MAGENLNNDLQSLVEAIKASDVVESRAQLLSKLRELDISGKSELASLIESLIMFWEDFTCLDVSQCMLNKTIVNVAAKYLQSDISGCLGLFLALGTKASIWCGKHLKMTLMSTDESQEEEHCNLFFQLLLDLLSYSAASFSALARYPLQVDKELMVIVENFIIEQLNLTKDSMLEIKRIHAFGLEILKIAQGVLDAVIRLCKVYSDDVNWDFINSRIDKAKNIIDFEGADNAIHVINTTSRCVEKLCELGILAAKDGGSLVTILNLSWRGVVTLLQLGKGALAVKVDVADIVLTLISLANESLRCAAENWSSVLKEAVSVADAKRIFLPVKFYLINAVRISSQYPCQAFSIYRDITLCVLMISTFRISLSKVELLKSASELLGELLEPTAFHLLNCLLNSAQVKQEHKFQILDWLFIDESDLMIIPGDRNSNYRTTSIDKMFSLNCDAMHGARILLLGRVALFLSFLKSAADLEEDVILGITRKLGWLFNVLIDEEVYSSVLALQVPILYGSSKTPELAYEPMFSNILHALKTFMIVVYSSPAWGEMESFLLENFLHPHFLCWEIVMELWCFVVHHAEIDMVTDIIDKLCLLLRFVASSNSVLVTGSALRKIARSICMILSCCPQNTVDRAYGSIVGSSGSKLSSIMFVALLMEGFQLNLLSDKMRSVVEQRIVTEYFEFVESFNDESLRVCDSDAFGAPVFAMSAVSQSLQVSITDIDMKTLKFLVSVIHNYRNSADNLTKDRYCKLLSETLAIISTVKHLYGFDKMEEIILELQGLFISGPAVPDIQLNDCKPSLALFMAGLGHMELPESAKSSALWELFHMLLRERHWACVHLAITAFGYFAARTSCTELWRFVPENAALSFDLASGKEANEERFMAELKAFLDRDMALLTTTPSSDQLRLLMKEGLVLKEAVQKFTNIDPEPELEPEVMECKTMDIDGENQANKRRKLLDGINQGVELLQSGLKIIGDGLSQLQQQNHFDSNELQDKFLTHFSGLEDCIAHLLELANNK
ncbi:uncharacterized protein LOC132274900 [Cornus florida]|uniref:uncharacterized protein LOC132274900 n=1 Tax=Cornus florida TaxID=4283 RepID=UPI00289E6702|nr:uncharacterized protein LOC132274900 [Cornus florida]